MKQTTNKDQREYMVAKAHVKALGEREKELEQAYISAHGIVNPDGSTPDRVYCIEDEASFDKANEEFSSEMTACGFDVEYEAARNALKTAEDNLIKYGLSIVPAGIRDTLAEGAKSNCTARQKLIDLVLRLDVSTVPR